MSSNSERIHHAETERVAGSLPVALAEAITVGDIPPEEIPQLSQETLREKMQAWRIWVVTLGSLANARRNGNQAAVFLQEAKNVINTHYENPLVIPEAENMRTTPEGNEYQMRGEMLRDRGSYWVKLFALTKNSAYLDFAAEDLQEAIEQTTEGSSARALAQMELFSVNRKRGRQEDFGRYTQAYEQVVALSAHAGGPDRKAASSWLYINEAVAVGNIDAVRVGFQNLQDATKQGNISWQKYLFKRIMSKGTELSRRLTYTQDPTTLELRRRSGFSE